jgi:hypothetical protein
MESPRTVPSAWKNLHLACRQTSTRLPRVEQFKCHPRSPCVERQMAFRVSDLAESGGFLGGNRESGERSLSRHQTDYRLDKSNCDAKTRLPLPRRGATLPCVTGRRDCHSERV